MLQILKIIGLVTFFSIIQIAFVIGTLEFKKYVENKVLIKLKVLELPSPNEIGLKNKNKVLCYLNSAVQMLSTITEFKKALLNLSDDKYIEEKKFCTVITKFALHLKEIGVQIIDPMQIFKKYETKLLINYNFNTQEFGDPLDALKSIIFSVLEENIPDSFKCEMEFSRILIESNELETDQGLFYCMIKTFFIQYFEENNLKRILHGKFGLNIGCNLILFEVNRIFTNETLDDDFKVRADQEIIWPECLILRMNFNEQKNFTFEYRNSKFIKMQEVVYKMDCIIFSNSKKVINSVVHFTFLKYCDISRRWIYYNDSIITKFESFQEFLRFSGSFCSLFHYIFLYKKVKDIEADKFDFEAIKQQEDALYNAMEIQQVPD